MEVRIESMICLWDDKIPSMFLEFINLLTLCQSEEQLRASVKDFSEKHDVIGNFVSSKIGKVKSTIE